MFSSGVLLSQELKENSIGVAFIKGETKNTYELQIIFPFEALNNVEFQKPVLNLTELPNKFVIFSPITFFDDKGSLITTSIRDSIRIIFWCENDGGIQFRPTFSVKIDKKQIKRKIKRNPNAFDVSCFVITNLNTCNLSPIPDSHLNENVKLTGDFNGDGQIDVVVWERPDDSGICTMSYHLSANKQDYYINCCGP